MKREIVRAAWLLGVAIAANSGRLAAQGEGAGPPPDPGPASDFEGGYFQNLMNNVHVGGFIRPEFAISTTNQRNENNTRGDPYNNIPVVRPTYNPDTTFLGVANGGSGGTTFITPFPLVRNIGERIAPNSGDLFHYHIVRTEITADVHLGPDVSITSRLRLITDPGHYSNRSVSGDYFGGDPTDAYAPTLNGADPALYGGGPNLFAYHAEKRNYVPAPVGSHYTQPCPSCAPNPILKSYSISNHPVPLEWGQANYLLYFPALFLDFQHGPLDVRIGNQQIAWGQALFFRVLDVPDGLDTRRHLILDQAAEEFSDKRTPAPAIRVGYQFSDDVLADAFVERFTPTILPNPETPYNLIPDQFTVHDLYLEKANRLSYGIRLKGNFGNYGLQLIAVRHMDPAGAFRWTQSSVAKGLPLNDQRIPGVPQPAGDPDVAGVFNLVEAGNAALEGASSTGPVPCTHGETPGQCQFGQLFSQTPFEAGASGVYSANEYFHGAEDVRLNAVTTVNAAIVPFPASQAALAGPVTGHTVASSPVPYSYGYSSNNLDDPRAATRARNELDTFFAASGGGLRGHIAREYFAETVLGGGASYVTQGTPGSVFDQLIINLETSYTPKHTFTDPSLYRSLQDPYLRQANWITALVMEKYQRFSQTFPATYFVLQFEHRAKDDIFGRSLRGYAGSGGKADSLMPFRVDNVAGDTTTVPNSTAVQGVSGGANYVVFAFLQPFPRLVYRFDFASLCDIRGACLVQPGLRWKPNTAITVDGFYTYINSHWSGNKNNNALSTLSFADEFTMRIAYQF